MATVDVSGECRFLSMLTGEGVYWKVFMWTKIQMLFLTIGSFHKIIVSLCMLSYGSDSAWNSVLHYTCIKHPLTCFCLTCRSERNTEWMLVMVSRRLWASSMITTLPSSLIPEASLVPRWRSMLYGSTTTCTKEERDNRWYGVLIFNKLQYERNHNATGLC